MADTSKSTPSEVPEDLASKMVRHRYAEENYLQDCEVYLPNEGNGKATDENKLFWVIFVHGGGWRDPTSDASDFNPALRLLLRSDLASKVAGYASLNYRQSPHPRHPQDPDKTPAFELRNAKHPDHIHDVIMAIGHLQQKYGFGHRYLLAGHSAGGALVYQVVMSNRVPWLGTGEQSLSSAAKALSVAQPMGVLGVQAIYDIPALLSSFFDEEFMRGMLEGAFGPDMGVWAAASPAKFNDYHSSWTLSDTGTGETDDKATGAKKRGRVAGITHNPDDEMIALEQVKLMETCLEKNLMTDHPENKEAVTLKTLKVSGDHHQAWKEGTDFARLIQEMLTEMIKLEG